MLLLWLLLLSSVRSQFTNPARFRREKWVVGDVEKIEFDTDLEEFTIAIWQQSLSQGAASKGPVIYRKLVLKLANVCPPSDVTP